MEKNKKILSVIIGIALFGIALGINYFAADLSADSDTKLLQSNDHTDDFVFNFYKQAISGESSNVFFSPFSISTAFSMAYEGARGETRTQMQTVFDFDKDAEQQRQSISDAMNRLNYSEFYSLEIVNGVWLAEHFEAKQDFVDAVTEYYGPARSVNFVTDEGVNEINKWVREKTHDKIKKILESGSTDELTRMILTNAVYFNGKWSNQFNPDQTRQEIFWTGKDNSVKTDMMKNSGMFNFAETNSAKVLEMNYVGNDISMLVLLPKQKDGLDSLEMSLDSDKLNKLRNMMERQSLTVHIPKFEFETDYVLGSMLANLGIRDAFDKNSADFTGITDQQVYISTAKHKAFVSVDEEGTEAAAVTVLVVQPTSGLPKPTNEFVADHPFVFVIQEKSTGEVLFIGRVVDPTT